MTWPETQDPKTRDPRPDEVVPVPAPAPAQYTNSDEPEARILTPQLPYSLRPSAREIEGDEERATTPHKSFLFFFFYFTIIPTYLNLNTLYKEGKC